MQYDYLVVGSGLYGAVFARQATDKGKKVLVVERRNHIAGNVYTQKIKGIDVQNTVRIFSIQTVKSFGIT